ncbi:MAG: outer membrane beta-barrel protein [Bacteroidota bacterium]
MRKWIFIFIPLLVGYQSLAAQDMVGCTQLLEDAKEAYSAGMVELVPELLLPCLESGGLTGTSKQDAYKLVINAYLFDYLPEEADSLMTDFVDDFPDYRADADDPAEFVLLLESNLRARGIDPNKPVVSEEDLVVAGQDGRQTAPVRRQRTPFDYKNSLGFLLGLNGTFPQIVERYSIGDPTLDEGSFGFSPGYQLGVTMNLILGESAEASFGLHYNRTRFNYTASPLSFTTYEYDEYQSHLQIPASMIFKLNPESGGACIYLRFGIVGDYLMAASGSGIRSYTASLKDVVVEKTEITDSRARLNLQGVAGLGIRIPLERSFIFLETRFASGLFLENREENRYENQDLTWLLYHVDSDFRSHQLSFSAGIAWNL